MIEGYGVRVDFDGETLRARGTNKVTHVALLGPDKDQPEAVVPRSEIRDVRFKDATRITNGNLIVETTGGKKYQLHFRRKQADDFRQLADALGVEATSDLDG